VISVAVVGSAETATKQYNVANIKAEVIRVNIFSPF